MAEKHGVFGISVVADLVGTGVQYLRAYERVIDIFETRRDQDRVIRTLAAETKSDLETIWHEQYDADSRETADEATRRA